MLCRLKISVIVRFQFLLRFVIHEMIDIRMQPYTHFAYVWLFIFRKTVITYRVLPSDTRFGNELCACSNASASFFGRTATQCDVIQWPHTHTTTIDAKFHFNHCCSSNLRRKIAAYTPAIFDCLFLLLLFCARCSDQERKNTHQILT